MAKIRSLIPVVAAVALLVVLTAVTPRVVGAAAGSLARCQETQLDVKWVLGGAGLGHTSDVIVITNISGNTCTETGYPVVTMTRAKSTVATTAKTTRNGYLGGLGGPNSKVPLPVVTLRAHGGTASSMVEGGDVPIGSAVTCLLYTKVSIALPRLSPPYHFTTRFSGCVRPQVHPIVKGSNGSSGK